MRADRALRLLFKGKAKEVIAPSGDRYFIKDGEMWVGFNHGFETRSTRFNGDWKVIPNDLSKKELLDQALEEFNTKVRKILE